MVSYYDKVMKRISLLDQYRDICNDVLCELTTKLNKSFKTSNKFFRLGKIFDTFYIGKYASKTTL